MAPRPSVFLKDFLGHCNRGDRARPARVKRQVGDSLDQLLLGDAIFSRSDQVRPNQSVIETGDLKVNLDDKTAEIGGQRVYLTSKEYQMLELLALRKGSTITKEMFLNHLYGGMDEPEMKIIDVFICKLRKKLLVASGGKNYIETVWGRGYVIRPAGDEQAAA